MASLQTLHGRLPSAVGRASVWTARVMCGLSHRSQHRNPPAQTQSTTYRRSPRPPRRGASGSGPARGWPPARARRSARPTAARPAPGGRRRSKRSRPACVEVVVCCVDGEMGPADFGGIVVCMYVCVDMCTHVELVGAARYRKRLIEDVAGFQVAGARVLCVYVCVLRSIKCMGGTVELVRCPPARPRA